MMSGMGINSLSLWYSLIQCYQFKSFSMPICSSDVSLCWPSVVLFTYKSAIPMLVVLSLSCFFTPSTYVCFVSMMTNRKFPSFNGPLPINANTLSGNYIKKLVGTLELAILSGKFPCVHPWVSLINCFSDEFTGLWHHDIYSHLLECTKYLGIHFHYRWTPSHQLIVCLIDCYSDGFMHFQHHHIYSHALICTNCVCD